MNHLQKATELITESKLEVFTKERRQLAAQQATAHALIALVQRVDRLLALETPEGPSRSPCPPRSPYRLPFS